MVHQLPSNPPPFDPWKNLRVVDFTHVVAGPTIAKLLAEHGADVIHCRYPYQDHILGFDVDTSFGKKNTSRTYVPTAIGDGRSN